MLNAFNFQHIPKNKTKIVCTIGPATEKVQVIKRLIDAGMNIARLNFSHGDFQYHKKLIKNIRQAALETKKPVAIMADLPGPKMRIGFLKKEPVVLEKGQDFILTTEDVIGDSHKVSVSIKGLPNVIKKGNSLYLNDGLIQLEVVEVKDKDIVCKVISGGEIRSKKGLNIPGVELKESVFTEKDKLCLEFAIKNGVDAVSQSFVSKAADIKNIRSAANRIGKVPFIIAKIERASSIDRLDEIIEEADGIMIARGDLGVEIPIERIALVQKLITKKALLKGKPVITATQMLVSMTKSKRPTRAEATDVANAILDGTDAVMLSEESATGKYPIEATEMLSRIAQETEHHIDSKMLARKIFKQDSANFGEFVELMAASLRLIAERMKEYVIFCPTDTGNTARALSRYRFDTWILGISSSKDTCDQLMFSFGVLPVFVEDKPISWQKQITEIALRYNIKAKYALLIEGPSKAHPMLDHRIEILKLKS